jgi:hypothetical protein
VSERESVCVCLYILQVFGMEDVWALNCADPARKYVVPRVQGHHYSDDFFVGTAGGSFPVLRVCACVRARCIYTYACIHMHIHILQGASRCFQGGAAPQATGAPCAGRGGAGGGGGGPGASTLMLLPGKGQQGGGRLEVGTQGQTGRGRGGRIIGGRVGGDKQQLRRQAFL